MGGASVNVLPARPVSTIGAQPARKDNIEESRRQLRPVDGVQIQSDYPLGPATTTSFEYTQKQPHLQQQPRFSIEDSEDSPTGTGAKSWFDW